MKESDIEIINTSYHKHMTDNHLAQINFTAYIPEELAQMYFDKTSMDHQNLGRVRFIQNTIGDAGDNKRLVFGRVSHGYGYDIAQDIYNAITDSKGVTK